MDIFYILKGFSFIVLMLSVGLAGLRYLVEYLTRLYPLRRFSRLIYGEDQDYQLSSTVRSFLHIETEVWKSSFIVYICILLSFILLYLPYLWSPLYEYDNIVSHIQVEMNGAYIKNETISVPVKISGLDRGLSVTLSKVDSKNLQEISSLIFYSNDSSPYINNSLVGKANGAGSYHFFLNTTKMSPGYYELKFENIKNKQINSINYFSLS